MGVIQWLESLCGVYEHRMRLMCDILAEGQDLISSVESGEKVLVQKSRITTSTLPTGGHVRLGVCQHYPTPRVFGVDQNREEGHGGEVVGLTGRWGYMRAYKGDRGREIWRLLGVLIS
jgi:hypothetical protein